MRELDHSQLTYKHCKQNFYSNPRRTTTGISINRLHQILAVIEKHVGIKLSEFDCYVATGGGFEISDPSSDLGVNINIIKFEKYSSFS